MSHLPAIDTNDHVQGPRDAAVVLVEYGDFECPYCGEAYPELKAVQAALGDALCFVFRHFPLSTMHPHAARAAEFAEAAATVGRFWEMHDWLYENQSTLDDRHLVAQAERLGLSRPLIDDALGGEFSARVHRDFVGGTRAGVNGTPCLFINGQRHEGDWDAPSLIAALQALLRRR